MKDVEPKGRARVHREVAKGSEARLLASEPRRARNREASSKRARSVLLRQRRSDGAESVEERHGLSVRDSLLVTKTSEDGVVRGSRGDIGSTGPSPPPRSALRFDEDAWVPKTMSAATGRIAVRRPGALPSQEGPSSEG